MAGATGCEFGSAVRGGRRRSDRADRSRQTVLFVGAAAGALAASIAAPACSFAQAAQAPAQASSLAEIVVTATKQKQDLDKVAISIAAIGQAKMDIQGVRSVGDIARRVPGVDFSQSPFGSGTGSTIAIRGISSNTGASTTGVYIDDVAIQSRANQENFTGSAFPQVFDLDRVEVLRGPQGTLWGAGAEGGAIRFITPEPNLRHYQGYARAEVSSTESGAPSYEAGGAVGGPIVADKLGFRASIWGRRDGGYVDRVNYETGAVSKDSNFQDTVVSRLALRWTPTASVTVEPSLFFQKTSVNDTSGIWESESNLDKGQYRNGHVLRQPAADVFYQPAVKAQAELGPVDLVAVASWFYRQEKQLADDTNFESVIWTGQPFPSLPGQNAPSFIGTSQSIPQLELRLQSHDPNARLKWTIGAFYSDAREYDYNKVEDIYLDQLLENAFGLNVQQFFGIPLTDGKYTFVGTTVSHDRQLALFGQVDYKILENLTLTAGLRLADTRFSFSQGFAGPVNYSGSGPDGRTIVGKQKEQPVTPKVGLSYQLSPTKLLYFSAAEGYRVGGANSPVPLNPACKANLAELGLTSSPLEYQSDNTWSYEVGYKGRSFENRLQVEASAYRINWSNIQQYVGLPSCGGIGFTANLGDATINGFDLQVNARPMDQLTLSASVGYTDATFNKTVGSNGVVIVNKGDAVGSPPVGVTPWTISASAEYHFAPQEASDPFLLVEDVYRSHASGHAANLDDPAALGYDPAIPFDPATNLLNARLGANLHGAQVSLFVNNLLNSHPLLQRTHDIPGSPLFYDNTFRPRTIGATVTYRY